MYQSTVTQVECQRLQFHWEQAQQESFNNLKDELNSTPVVAHYDPQNVTMLSANASSLGLGAELVQEQDNKEKKPVAYASRSMTSTEQRYAQIEKEALAITSACEKFNDYILGKNILTETDQKPLVPLFGWTTPKNSKISNETDEVFVQDTTCRWERFGDCRCPFKSTPK